MSTPVTYVAQQYNVPAFQDTGWAQGAGNLSSYLIALATGSLTLSGGNFPLTADANFGGSFGLVSLYYKTRTANLASTGQFRMARTDFIAWRDAGNTADLELAVNASDQLTFNGFVIASSSGALVGTTLTLSATSNQMVIGTTRTVTLTLPTPASASRTITFPDLSGDYSLIGTIGAQTITGAKTFANQTLLLQEVGSTDVITINVAALAASRAYTLPDAGGAASFIMSEGTQTINGTKTFGSAPTLPGANMTGTLAMAGNPVTGLTSINNSFFGWGRNRLINGDMRIDQKNAGASVTVNAATVFWGPDMWGSQGVATDGVFTMQRSTTAPTGFTNSMVFTVTTADASIPAASAYNFLTGIEGSMMWDWAFGTANAKALVLSFYVRSSVTGTFGGAVMIDAETRSCPFTYVINSANTWERKTIAIPGDTSGSWVTSNAIAMTIRFSLGIGANKTGGTPGTWGANQFYAPSGVVDLINTLNATLYITGVQLEASSSTYASDFENRPENIELIMCQRYYEKSYNMASAEGSNASGAQYVGLGGQFNTTSMETAIVPFKVRKRAAPTITLYQSDGSTNNWEWFNTSGTATVRTTTAPEIIEQGFAIRQTTAVEYLTVGHWVAAARLF